MGDLSHPGETQRVGRLCGGVWGDRAQETFLPLHALNVLPLQGAAGGSTFLVAQRYWKGLAPQPWEEGGSLRRAGVGSPL